MHLLPIEKLIPEKQIVIFAPHYDDSLFMLGGYMNELKKKDLLDTKQFHVLIFFSRSNYLAGSGNANYDLGLERVKYATGQRLLEDMNCLNEQLGVTKYRYELIGENECLLRGKTLSDSEMEFPHGMYEDFQPEDEEIFQRTQVKIASFAAMEDTALIFPLAYKEHVDHFILREAAIHVLDNPSIDKHAAFYFQEDKPYSGIASEAEHTRVEAFIIEHALTPLVYDYDPERIIELACKHYISQVEPVYITGIHQRAQALAKRYGLNTAGDRICRA